MKMVNMKLSQSESEMECCPSPMESEKSKYPYGICIRFDNEMMQKLGFTDLPEVGQQFKIEAVGMVDSVNKSENMDSEPYMSFSIQITDIGLDDGKKKTPPEEKLYGKK